MKTVLMQHHLHRCLYMYIKYWDDLDNLSDLRS